MAGKIQRVFQENVGPLRVTDLYRLRWNLLASKPFLSLLQMPVYALIVFGVSEYTV